MSASEIRRGVPVGNGAVAIHGARICGGCQLGWIGPLLVGGGVAGSGAGFGGAAGGVATGSVTDESIATNGAFSFESCGYAADVCTGYPPGGEWVEPLADGPVAGPAGPKPLGVGVMLAWPKPPGVFAMPPGGVTARFF